MALRGPSSHGSMSSSTPTPDMRSTGLENRASSAATIRSHMHASIEPGGRAGALHRGDRHLAEVADAHELVEVHGLLVRELALGGVAPRGPVLLAREELLQVVPGREVLAIGGQHHDAHVGVGVGAVEGGVELVDQPAVLRVGRFGAGERDRRDRTVRDVANGLERGCHGPDASGRLRVEAGLSIATGR